MRQSRWRGPRKATKTVQRRYDQHFGDGRAVHRRRLRLHGGRNDRGCRWRPRSPAGRHTVGIAYCPRCALRQLGVAQRVRVEAGSFFESVPAGADTYVLKHIIHDWPEDDALAILRNLRAAASAKATVLLVEMVLGVDGRERTAAEYRALLERSGFRMTRQDDKGGADSVTVQPRRSGPYRLTGTHPGRRG